ncbi:MAG: hypothetical protein K2L17_03550 [Muribaculaceae bacterium]|nr:hypothetical protein [Muribaculaceae bacterium]
MAFGTSPALPLTASSESKRGLNTEWLTLFAGCFASYALSADDQPLRVLNALSVLFLFRAVAPLSVYQQSTG